ncbi:paraquat-inducible protein A [Thermotomaculum hydrothermale]|uniref:Paraquat-inducible protein A n=1 Tax=Thermotomaculum hydrothermale TaxID=981385 RepID=A0A7R6PFI5_9BACT|nr:paraquat-inducible protein A [Thermotomaculum hydrothermale]BBB32793.1 paraquat-inducible protein A [Thermotomaculum hydrothermale]
MKLDEHYKRKVLFKSWGYSLTALFFMLPAYLLPMMITGKLGKVEENTIFSGVVYFFVNGDYFIACVIFVASILIPIVKIVGVIFLLLVYHFKVYHLRERAVTLYHILHFIGKWSMLDVFVVALMSSLVQFGFLSYAKPGPAVIPFALVVIFTILATKKFDTKLYWSE